MKTDDIQGQEDYFKGLSSNENILRFFSKKQIVAALTLLSKDYFFSCNSEVADKFLDSISDTNILIVRTSSAITDLSAKPDDIVIPFAGSIKTNNDLFHFRFGINCNGNFVDCKLTPIDDENILFAKGFARIDKESDEFKTLNEFAEDYQDDENGEVIAPLELDRSKQKPEEHQLISPHRELIYHSLALAPKEVQQKICAKFPENLREKENSCWFTKRRLEQKITAEQARLFSTISDTTALDGDLTDIIMSSLFSNSERIDRPEDQKQIFLRCRQKRKREEEQDSNDDHSKRRKFAPK